MEFMSPFYRLVFSLMVMSAAALTPARAQNAALYVVTYVDVMPHSSDDGATLLERYRDATRKQDGNLRTDVLQEIGRPNRFAIIEVWKDKAAFDAHGTAASTAQFRDKLKTIEDAPYDERITNGLYVGASPPERHSGAIYVVTHVDVIPPGKDDCVAALEVMGAETPKDPGYIGYEVLQQANRSNHFTVLEIWADKKSLDGHAEAAHTRAFRVKLVPAAGALYDERFYKALG
jgi:quinol monooxygenase YgiN